MGLPPGPHYLSHLIPYLTLPPLLVFTCLHILSINLSTPLPLYLQILALALSWPIAFTALVQWCAWTNKWNTSVMGMVMLEKVKHKLPGSLDILIKMFESDKSLYLSKSLFSVFLHAILCAISIA